MVTLMEHLLLETSEVVHDQRLLSGIDQVDAVGKGEEAEASECEQLTEFVSHDLKLYLIQMEHKQALFIPSAQVHQK